MEALVEEPASHRGPASSGAAIRIERVDQQSFGRWQAFVDSMPDARPMHHSAWLHILAECASVKPLHLSAVDDEGRVIGVLPLYLSRSTLAGRHLTSMDGGTLSCDPAAIASLHQEAIRLRESLGAGYLLLRGGPAPTFKYIRTVQTVRTIFPTDRTAEDAWSSLDSNMRRKIRKARKNGISVERDISEIDRFYGVYARNLHFLGTPVMGRSMFRAMRRHLGERLRLYIVRFEGKVIGGLLCLAHERVWTGYYLAVDRGLLKLYPTYLLIWEAIREACESGVESFDMGRSVSESGSHRFKRQWKGYDLSLHYRFAYAEGVAPKSRRRAYASGQTRHEQLWARLPLSVANRLGPILRREQPFL